MTTPLPAIGSPAPCPPAIDHEGRPVDLAALYASGDVLLYFYPKANTPGCTAQACNLRDHFELLQTQGLTLLGVSGDKPATQRRFRDKHQLPFVLLADTQGELAQAFGVPTRLGMPARQSFLIRKGLLVWLDRKASPSRQAQDILAFLTPAPPTPS